MAARILASGKTEGEKVVAGPVGKVVGLWNVWEVVVTFPPEFLPYGVPKVV